MWGFNVALLPSLSIAIGLSGNTNALTQVIDDVAKNITITATGTTANNFSLRSQLAGAHAVNVTNNSTGLLDIVSQKSFVL